MTFDLSLNQPGFPFLATLLWPKFLTLLPLTVTVPLSKTPHDTVYTVHVSQYSVCLCTHEFLSSQHTHTWHQVITVFYARINWCIMLLPVLAFSIWVCLDWLHFGSGLSILISIRIGSFSKNQFVDVGCRQIFHWSLSDQSKFWDLFRPLILTMKEAP